MTVKIAINGLGRIGRCVLRALVEYHDDYKNDIELVAINGPAKAETHRHLLQYDSVHGVFGSKVSIEESANGQEQLNFGLPYAVALYHERDPAKLPWADLNVDVVFECTGIFRKKEQAQLHIDAGAKKVLYSAPSPDADSTIVYGVNNNAFSAEQQFISVGSCTTNCLAPIAKILNDNFGIEQGYMTTIHSYTGDQNVVDSSHKDLRRARASAISMIPTSTGAAKALGLVLPELAGKLDGTAIRVPTPNVSMVDLVFKPVNANISDNDINNIMKKYAGNDMKGVLEYNDEPLVSVDFNHNPHSSIFDATQTAVMTGGKGEQLIRVASWYDNEWGFSVRMLDVAKLIG